MTSIRTAHGWRFAIDRGGTFTDVVARDPGGQLRTHKVLSRDPAHPGDAAVRAMRELLGAAGGDAPQRVESVRLGTTVATNALLERRGEATLLVTTRGFRDALRIGYQHRPDIFARRIVLPEPIYASVVEANERIDAAGAMLRPLDAAALLEALRSARADGLRSVAIVFLHGFRYPAHERHAARLARAAGFDEVVTSHETAPLVGLVARGDTTLLDAYLSPVLARYLVGFRAELGREFGEPQVLYMQSNGGLVDATGFRGVGSVLSGPAGGVVGMVAAGAAAGRSRVIGLDMGGTSTDVSLCSGGALPRRFFSEIAGLRLQAPMMDIHTIAAGGGSVVRFADGRLQVGPQSAGAWPGPACYRNGGPATLTDCNVVLGRIQAGHFPAVFGPAGAAPLDADAARAALDVLRREVAAGSDVDYDVEALAAAFVDIAVLRMAQAIRHVALQQGEDPADATLVCFGGAAGQHACAVADALGVREILVSPLAGVLSAQGIALASRRCVRRRTVEQALDDAGVAAAAEALAGLEREAVAELLRQGVAPQDCRVERRAQLRAAGSETTLDLDWQDAATMRRGFVDAQRRLYGFEDPSAAPLIAAVIVEAAETVAADAPAAGRTPDCGRPAPHRDDAAEPLAVAVECGDGRRIVPLLPGAALRPQDALDGPALLLGKGSTLWLAPGWRARGGPEGHLLLERHGAGPAAARAAAAGPDPMRLEVFNSLFMHVAEQMGEVLRQTASSVNIRERLDYSCAVFDAEAQLVANAPHMPVHLGSMGASVAAVLEAFRGDLRPGDACLVNSPYAGGTHLPDLTVVTPVFDAAGERIRFFTASRAHHADVGGMTPGSMPPFSRTIDDEGALLGPTRIVRGGRLAEREVLGLLATQRHPARNPRQNLADLRAQLAANTRGVEELRRAIRAHGEATVLEYMGHVQDNAERCMRRAIRGLGDGRFRYATDAGQAIEVAVAVDREHGAATVDFAGTSPQQPNNFNAPRAVTVAAVLYVFRTLVAEPIPLNAGCLRPIRIRIPAGSMLDPAFPGAVVAGNVETSQCIVDALYGALGLQAASQGTMNNFTFGNDRRQYYETIAGGAGAGPDYAGASGVQTHMTNSRLTDPEVLEQRYPVLLREFALRRGSGGAGRHRGGDGLLRRVEFRETMTAAILSNHRRVAPFGLAGGQPGAVGVNRLIRADGRVEQLGATAEVELCAGDAVEIATPGGGGYGPPG